jgi:hypothetical protein
MRIKVSAIPHRHDPPGTGMEIVAMSTVKWRDVENVGWGWKPRDAREVMEINNLGKDTSREKPGN